MELRNGKLNNFLLRPTSPPMIPHHPFPKRMPKAGNEEPDEKKKHVYTFALHLSNLRRYVNKRIRKLRRNAQTTSTQKSTLQHCGTHTDAKRPDCC